MNSAKVFSVVALASATTVASFMALMIIRGTMPIIQMAPFIGLNGAIVGGLFYLGIDAISSFGPPGGAEPKLVLVRNKEGRVLSIQSQGAPEEEEFSFFGSTKNEELDLFEEKLPLSQRLGLTQGQMMETIRTVLLIALLVETYMGFAYMSNNFTPFMVVTTGSMEPILSVGDMIYVKGVAPADIEVGDIITFKPPKDYISGTLITHRVVEIFYDSNQVYFKTKGDNNPSVDPWIVTPDLIIGRQTAALKGLGGLFLWFQTPAGLMTLAVVLGAYMFWPNIKEALGGVRLK
ncbi:MAG: signal peptidase I [Candidatus Bathyarchaeota archaeon]|nr:signal peptidase I [Candidatus Bathyarchaeota archaeon]